MRRFALLPVFAALAASAAAGAPSGSNVLVVYAANVPESVDVANAYAGKRSVPAANLCPIDLPDPRTWMLGAADYRDAVKAPVRACLDAVGRRDVLYIVLAYVRPYAVDPGGGLRYYSLDSYLADIWDQYARVNFDPYPQAAHRYFADNQAQGNFFYPYMPLSEFRRRDARQPLTYGVWRLDGSTPEIAKALVDKAIYAETHGLAGQACIDQLITAVWFADSGYRSADWDLHRAAQFLRMAGLPVLQDEEGAELGADPSARTCKDAALYSGWYSYNAYNDAFTWSPGAVGFHLDSGSALDPRGGSNWSANALNRNITVTSGAMAEPYLEGLPRPAGVFRNLLEGATAGDAFLRNTRWLKWRILNFGDPLYRPFPNGLAPFNAPFGENALYVGKREVLVDSAFEGSIAVDRPAPDGGVTVKLSSDAAAVVVPESVWIPANSNFVRFPITVGSVTSPAAVQVTADTGSTIVKNTISVYPVLGEVRTSAGVVTGGRPLTGTVVLNRAAPEGGTAVGLSSDRPEIARVPASVVVPEGASEAAFSIETAPVAAAATVKITAALDGATVSVTFVVKP